MNDGSYLGVFVFGGMGFVAHRPQAVGIRAQTDFPPETAQPRGGAEGRCRADYLNNYHHSFLFLRYKRQVAQRVFLKYFLRDSLHCWGFDGADTAENFRQRFHPANVENALRHH